MTRRPLVVGGLVLTILTLVDAPSPVRLASSRITDGAGRVGHAEITIGSSTIMLADERPETGVVSPATLGGSHMSLVVSVDDVDAVARRAVEAGGRLSRP